MAPNAPAFGRGGRRNGVRPWIIVAAVAAVALLGAGVLYFFGGYYPNTPLCNAYRDLNRAMKDGRYIADVTEELGTLQELASADPDAGVQSDADKLDNLGIVFDADDVKAATTNIMRKC